MNTIYIKKSVLLPEFKQLGKYLLLGLLLTLWVALPKLMGFDETTGYIDPSIWLLILLSLITFLVLVATCWWLLQRFWMALGLPALALMVSQFKFLEVWQQLGFYFACFSLLLLAGVGCLVAIL
ncbi:hypothetical protein [Pedobacter sp. ok626]|uniref:hypothetical protein n=1 Tax=Pedobacter sp. ok626 TaxID=1761882 RepID=UPI000B876BAE|nr:hypothetical protein [Pedobacter sp. ok626]